jgi:hypothetical protein
MSYENRPIIRPEEVRVIETSGELVRTERPSLLRRLQDLEVIITRDNFIDQGGAGAVYAVGEVCFKIFWPHKDGDFERTGTDPIKREAEFLMRVNDFSIAGVRTPRCFGYYRLPADYEGKSGLEMERVRGVNLQHVMNGTETPPQAFNPITFMDALWEYFEELHKRGILHNDVAGRNIMIAEETGLPVVIDLGEAIDLNTLNDKDRKIKISEELNKLDEIDKTVLLLTN